MTSDNSLSPSDTPLPVTSGDHLRVFIKRKGIKQKQLAEKLGVTKQAVGAWVHGTTPVPRAHITTLTTELELAPEETCSLTMRSHVLPPVPDAEQLKDQPDEKRAGLLLRYFRTHTGMSQEALAAKLAIKPSNIYVWETGGIAIDAAQLGNIAVALALSDNDAKRLKLARLPVLDSQWRESQPQEEHYKFGGMILRAFRELRGLIQSDLAQRLDITVTTLSFWETGKHGISAKNHDTIAQSLNLTSEEKSLLIELIVESNEAIRQRRGMNAMSTGIGTFIPRGQMDHVKPGNEQEAASGRHLA